MYNENYYNAAANTGYPTCSSTAGQCPCSYPGCMDPNMQYYDPAATCDDGSCVGWVVGCMDPNAFNYSPTATQDDGSCIAKTYGCTDASAHNFDPNANTDDGGCVAKVPGCSDPNAYNYNSAANRDCNDNPIPGGGNNQQSFSGYSNAAGRRRVTIGPSGRTTNPMIGPVRPPMRGSARMNEGWEVDGDIYRNLTERHHLKPQKRSSRGTQFSRPPIIFDSGRTRMNEGWEVDGDIYRNAEGRSRTAGWTNTGVVRARTDDGLYKGRYEGNPNAYSYLPPMPPHASGRYGEYNPDVPITNRGAVRMSEGWGEDGDIYRSAAGRRRVTVGPSGRTSGWDTNPGPKDIHEGKYQRNRPVHSRAISSEWNWPY